MANETARRLRQSMTPQEVKLWIHLRSWKARGFHFRRQVPKGRHIVDFACLKHRLVIEIDGGQHNYSEHAERDRIRDNTFKNAGYRVLRFWNHEIDQNIEGVLQAIDEVLKAPPPDGPSARHPPPSGEG
jgi:very-short-patch-repair endonuclease